MFHPVVSRTNTAILLIFVWCSCFLQANYFEQILREGHAHPQVKGMVTWAGYNPKGCYRMCLTDGNFRNLPTGDVVDKLLREWGGLSGQTTGLTDADGFFEASLFHGDYNLDISHPLTNSTASHSFKLTSEDSNPSPSVFRVWDAKFTTTL